MALLQTLHPQDALNFRPDILHSSLRLRGVLRLQKRVVVRCAVHILLEKNTYLHATGIGIVSTNQLKTTALSRFRLREIHYINKTLVKPYR